MENAKEFKINFNFEENFGIANYILQSIVDDDHDDFGFTNIGKKKN